MNQVIETLQNSLGESLPGVVGAFALLVIGWIIALIVKGLLKKGCRAAKLNDRMSSSGGGKVDLETGIAITGYYLTLAFVLVTVFNQLGLEVASQPIQALVSQGMDFIPKLIGGGILILIAWLAGTIIKKVLIGALTATKIDSKVKTSGKGKLSEALGEVIYWLVFLLFLPGILGVFQLEGLLAPAQSMVDKIMGILPNIMAAVIIIFVGWFIAKILREIVTNLLVAAGFDRLGEKIGIEDSTKLSSIIGLIVYFFTFIPALIAGLNALEIEAIAGPATQMLDSVMAMIPNFLGAIAILVITFYIAKPVAHFVSSLLKSANADDVPNKLGINLGKVSLSAVAGKMTFFFMMLFASVEASNRLEFTQFSDLVATFIQFGGQVLLGSAIIAIGMWIANLVSSTVNRTQKDGHTPLADLLRVVILGLVIAMGLRAMGLANDIVNMAFGLTLGAAAVAFALSFGIGGREAAGKQMEHWLATLRGEKK